MASSDDDRHGRTPSIPAWDIEPGLLEQIPSTDLVVLQGFRARRLIDLHHAALGRVAAEWALFESTVDEWLWIFANIKPEVGVCFTGQMIGPAPRTNAFVALVLQLGAEQKKWKKKLDKFSERARGLGERRNRALHDVWEMHDPERPQQQRATAKGRVDFFYIHVPTAELRTLADEIGTFGYNFHMEIANPIFDELRPSLDKGRL